MGFSSQEYWSGMLKGYNTRVELFFSPLSEYPRPSTSLVNGYCLQIDDLRKFVSRCSLVQEGGHGFPFQNSALGAACQGSPRASVLSSLKEAAPCHSSEGGEEMVS